MHASLRTPSPLPKGSQATLSKLTVEELVEERETSVTQMGYPHDPP